MTWFLFDPQAAVNLNADPVASGVGQIYAVDDVAFATPLTTRGPVTHAPMATVPIVQYVSVAFEVEDHTRVWWKSGAAPAVMLTSAQGMEAATTAAQTAAVTAQVAAEAAQASVAAEVSQAEAARDEAVAAAAAVPATVAADIADGASSVRSAGDAVWRWDVHGTASVLPGRLDNTHAVNGVAFAQDNVTTQDGVQYAVWCDADRHPIIGRRTLPHGRWTTFDLSTVGGNPLAAPTEEDGHNNYAVAVDADGYVHVAGNHHDDPLRYVRSTAPGDISAWTAPGMVGDSHESSVTYPQFLRTADELLFVFRGGSSGNGNVVINAYSTASKTWARRAIPLSGLAPVTPDESPYTNHLALDASGVLHVFYLWRTTADLNTTHDICYVRSADGGGTWTNAAGTPLALPVTPSTSPVVKAGALSTVNQSGADVDAAGRPHSAWWIAPDSTQLVHIWHDGAAWHEDVLVDFGWYVAPSEVARPMVFCHDGRTFVLYAMETTARTRWLCRDVTPSPASRLPEFELFDVDMAGWEPSFDTRALRERGELHMLATPLQPGRTGVGGVDDAAFVSQNGAVYTFDLSRLPEMSRATVRQEPSETMWVGAAAFQPSSGSPTLNGSTMGVPAWLLDAAATEVVTTTLMVPSGWRQFAVDLWWTNAGAGAGDVVVNTRYANRGDTTNITGAEVNAGNVGLAAPAQNVIKVNTVLSGLIRKPDQLFRVNVRRVGGDAGDTLGNDMALLGLVLRRTA